MATLSRPAPSLRGVATVAAALAVVGVIGFALRKLAGHIDPAAIGAAIGLISPWRIAAAIGLTAASHLLLTLYDSLALRSLGEKVRWRTAARAAFTSYTLSHNLGFAPITGGSARLRIYGAAGLDPAAVARIVVIAGCAFWGGIVAVTGVSLVAEPGEIAAMAPLFSPLAIRLAGLILLAGIAALLLAPGLDFGLGRRMERFIPRPGAELVAGLLSVAALDLLLAAAALLVLLPAVPLHEFPQLFVAYAVAVVLGLVTHVPGGIGVFEGTVLVALGTHDPHVAAGLVAYRAIYYLLPLAASLVLNAAIEAAPLGRPLRRLGQGAAMELGPLGMAGVSFACGLLLLASGTLPGEHYRLAALSGVLPLALIEASHLAASLCGTALLLVAPALLKRSRAGFVAAQALLLLGATCSLGKGLDFEEAALLLGASALLRTCRVAFYRRTTAAFSAHNRAWLVAAAVSVAGSIIAGLFVYRHAAIDGDAWWRFALRSDVSRFLRASLATGLLMTGFAVRELLSRPPVDAGLPVLPGDVFAHATQQCGRSDAMLALTGDKRFLVSAEGDAFVMFRPVGRTWFVMGDPVGSHERWPQLLWELRRQSDLAGASLCIYQASDAFLPLAVELGLNPVKYGEEAIVDPRGFTLEGARMKSLRNGVSRARREGLRVLAISRDEVPGWLERLRAVSDAWLARHGRREKRFSLGWFSESYLRACDIAVIVDAADRVVAFANLWRSGDGEELSVDLMRQLPDAPPGTMDMLLCELIAGAGCAGGSRFNLGLAPLSGMRGGRLAPWWARGASLLFGLGARDYDFQGLRRYKEKFAPRWENRYIALPPGLAGGTALLRLLRLVGG